ncbi:MAG: HAD family hydrolase [Candidatus Berkiella sp.]
MKKIFNGIVFCFLISLSCCTIAKSDPLVDWNDGPAKQAIITFVQKVTDKNSPDYVPDNERIAVFDNDGTLWVEHPMYTQLAFAIDRVKALAPSHPEWKEQQPFKAILENDVKTLEKTNEAELVKIIMTTHTGISSEEFDNLVKEWLKTARHPKYNKPYTKLVYQPMIELMNYLRENGFQVFIVSGGGIEFMRTFALHTYGVPPWQVIGSSVKTQYQSQGNKHVLMRLPEINLIDDKAGKPVGIQTYIGLRPIAAFGNSDGDYQMLEWTTEGPGLRLGAIVHHTDDKREYQYDRHTPFGKLDKGLDDAKARGWILIDMKNDWKRIWK